VFAWAVIYFVAGAPMMMLLLVMAAVRLAPAPWPTCPTISPVGSTASWPRGRSQQRSLAFATNAIREGGLFRRRVGEGQVKWSLPDAHTDFIIAVAAEEYGLMLVLAVIVLYLVITVRAFLRLIVERDPFIRFAGCGIAALFGAQAIINMGVAVRLLPAKGMTLPFVSYGGSSMIADGHCAGHPAGFTRERPQGAIGDMLRGRVPG
jgi:cell division protein FtsW